MDSDRVRDKSVRVLSDARANLSHTPERNRVPVLGNQTYLRPFKSGFNFHDACVQIVKPQS